MKMCCFFIQRKLILMKEREKLKQCGQYFDYIIRNQDTSTIYFTEGKLLVEVLHTIFKYYSHFDAIIYFTW